MSDRRLSIGLALLVGGILLSYYAHQQVQSYERGWGPFKKAFSEEHSDRAARYQAFRVAGVLAALGGGVLVGASLAKKS